MTYPGIVPVIDPNAYVRPADWLTMPTVTAGDQKVVALHAVWDHESSIVRIQCSGAYTVDWGDGSAAQNIATNLTVTHSYTYSAISSGTQSTQGYRQVIITITPQAGQNLTSVNLALIPSLYSGDWSPGWLDIRMAGSLISSLTLAGSAPPRMLERFEFVGTNAITNFNAMFFNAVRLRSVVAFHTASGTDFTSMFQGCASLRTIPLITTTAGTNFTSMFQGCVALATVPLIVTTAGTNFTSMFQDCTTLRTIPLLNTGVGTTFTSMFNGCAALQTIPLINTSLGITFTNMFNNCYVLQAIPLLNVSSGTTLTNMFNGCTCLAVGAMQGTKANINYFCALGPSALNSIYANLASVSAKAITVAGNWGVSADNPAIATAKGWTVSGS